MEQPIQSCLIWPAQMMVKYVLLLKEILDCLEILTESGAAQKLKEAISVMEQVIIIIYRGPYKQRFLADFFENALFVAYRVLYRCSVYYTFVIGTHQGKRCNAFRH